MKRVNSHKEPSRKYCELVHMPSITIVKLASRSLISRVD